MRNYCQAANFFYGYRAVIPHPCTDQNKIIMACQRASVVLLLWKILFWSVRHVPFAGKNQKTDPTLQSICNPADCDSTVVQPTAVVLDLQICSPIEDKIAILAEKITFYELLTMLVKYAYIICLFYFFYSTRFRRLRKHGICNVVEHVKTRRTWSRSYCSNITVYGGHFFEWVSANMHILDTWYTSHSGFRHGHGNCWTRIRKGSERIQIHERRVKAHML